MNYLASIVIASLLMLQNTYPAPGPGREAYTVPFTGPALVVGQVAVSYNAVVTLPSNVTTGNVVVVWFTITTAGGYPSFSDSKGNTYTLYATESPGANFFSGFGVVRVATGGFATITPSTAGGAGSFIAAEFTPASAIEASDPAANGSFQSPLAIGPITTTATNTLVLLGGGVFNVGSSAPTNTGSWTTILSGSSNTPYVGLFSLGATTAGNYSNGILPSSTQMGAGMIGLKK